MGKAAFGPFDVLAIVAIVMLATAAAEPMLGRLAEERQVARTLGNLKNLHRAIGVYAGDSEGQIAIKDLPPPGTLFGPEFPVDRSLFSSPCANASAGGEAPSPKTVRYVLEFDPSSQGEFWALGGRAPLVFDYSCNGKRQYWSSNLAVKRVLGVTLDGAALDITRRGYPDEPGWWIEPTALRGGSSSR